MLIDELLDIFPDPSLADDEGLVAYGGELKSDVILSAYLKGIFPWFNEEPILWWSPNPRMVVYLDDFSPSKSLKQIIRKNIFEIKYDFNFEEVITQCAKNKRKGETGTWITHDMITAYVELHKMGYAHSIECYQNDQLVGGLYGLTLGRVFCGESMFFSVSNASKVAFYYLIEKLKTFDYYFIDCQTPTSHLKSLGGKEIERDTFLNELKEYVNLDILW